MADAQTQPTAQQLIGDFSPKMAELTDKVLFGDVWERPALANGIGVSRRSAPSLLSVHPSSLPLTSRSA